MLLYIWRPRDRRTDGQSFPGHLVESGKPDKRLAMPCTKQRGHPFNVSGSVTAVTSLELVVVAFVC